MGLSYADIHDAACKVLQWCANPPWSTTDNDNQTLSLNGTSLVISGGNDVDLSALISPAPTVKTCAGPWHRSSNPTGWGGFTTGSVVPNAWTDLYGTAADPWRTLLSWTTPACETDLTAIVSLGFDLHYGRDVRFYQLGGVQLRINGTAVYTNSAISYPYSDERTDTNPAIDEPLQYEWDFDGVAIRSRNGAAIPAGAIIEIRDRARVRAVAPQNAPWSRAYAGLRAHASVITTPWNVVTEVT